MILVHLLRELYNTLKVIQSFPQRRRNHVDGSAVSFDEDEGEPVGQRLKVTLEAERRRVVVEMNLKQDQPNQRLIGRLVPCVLPQITLI